MFVHPLSSLAHSMERLHCYEATQQFTKSSTLCSEGGVFSYQVVTNGLDHMTERTLLMVLVVLKASVTLPYGLIDEIISYKYSENPFSPIEFQRQGGSRDSEELNWEQWWFWLKNLQAYYESDTNQWFWFEQYECTWKYKDDERIYTYPRNGSKILNNWNPRNLRSVEEHSNSSSTNIFQNCPTLRDDGCPFSDASSELTCMTCITYSPGVLLSRVAAILIVRGTHSGLEKSNCLNNSFAKSCHDSALLLTN